LRHTPLEAAAVTTDAAWMGRTGGTSGRTGLAIAAATLLAASPAYARDTLAARSGWAAFRDGAPPACRAVTRAVAWSRGGRAPHVDIAVVPGRVRGQVHFALSRAGSDLRLIVGERAFPLVSRGSDAWLRDAADDDAVLASMRSGGVMRVEGVARGRPFRDVYRLEGAPTAIDAARLGCPG
jgi:hypothetical protein